MSPSKKKGKSSKLARMSDEERARYLQHRAAIEEEARRRKQQLIATFIKNKLKKEEVFSRLNGAKINQQWRHTLRVQKCQELQQEFNALRIWFDYTAEKKDVLIECLLGDLREAESQYSRIHQCHMETIDKLLATFNERISSMQKSFEEDRDKMFKSACSEMDSLTSGAIAEQEHLHTIIFRMQQTAEEESNRTHTIHSNRADELRNQMLTELETLKNGKSAQMETLWNSFQTILRKHWEMTEDRRREYLNLRHTDQENCKQILKNHQEINTLNDTLANLRDQLSSSHSESNNLLTELKAEKDDNLQLHQILRHRMSEEKLKDHRQLCKMSDYAQITIRDLTKVAQKGQQILHLMQLCQKLEGPFEEEKKKSQEEVDDFHDPIAKEAVMKFSKLRSFWNRFNQHCIEKQVLTLECKALEEEQAQLKSALKKFFSEFSNSQPLPTTPLVISRPSSSAQDTRGISLRGEKASCSTGRIDFCSDTWDSSIIHSLTIKLSK